MTIDKLRYGICPPFVKIPWFNENKFVQLNIIPKSIPNNSPIKIL